MLLIVFIITTLLFIISFTKISKRSEARSKDHYKELKERKKKN